MKLFDSWISNSGYKNILVIYNNYGYNFLWILYQCYYNLKRFSLIKILEATEIEH